MAGNQ